MIRKVYLFLFIILSFLNSCVEPFSPEVKSHTSSFLVVDGFINISGVTTIKLSRTQNLGENMKPSVENRAQLQIKEESGSNHNLTEIAPGTYQSALLNLNPGKRYQLHIRTDNGSEYLSLLTSASTTPDFELSSRIQNDGLQILVNTNDNPNSSRYYRWQYEETYEFSSGYYSGYEYKAPGKIEARQNDIYYCWRTEVPTFIKIGNTSGLNQNILSNQSIVFLPKNTEKLRYKYSILVKQYSLSKEEYQYWEILSKNTEQIGTLFDPLPSQLTGNIQCLNNPAEPVLGFVGATSEKQKRIFVDKKDLPVWPYKTGYESCAIPDTVGLGDAVPLFANGGSLPVGGVYRGPALVGYTYSTPDCVDCRLRGTKVRPSFWQ
ncbi:DUF4249 domain-containing protein [Adhaeribacter aquaticus]|uniref:DUF4249 domain-containing protein n=1 Tax=Adhaeribacter aquaticus TaxID=299567 RepID=UPI00041168BC|nr:DUF4249 domain-containing protein [Adhaeribacter aquaticus]